MKYSLPCFFALAIMLSACSKPEGQGGTASLCGSVYAINFSDKNSSVLDTTRAQGEDVYIIYGDKKELCDKQTTNKDGYYVFDYLRPGTYTVVAFARDPEKGDVKKAVEKIITLKGKKDKSVVEDMYLYKPTKGACSITGTIYRVDFSNDLTVKPDTLPATEEDVYIVEQGSNVVLDKQTTGIQGKYRFDFLIHKSYTIIAYTKNHANGGDKQPVMVQVTLGQGSQSATASPMYLYKASEGYATITGRLYAKNYTVAMKPKMPADNYYLGGEDIFIQQKGSVLTIDRIKSGDGGWFMFPRLSVGTYYVYALSKDTVPVFDGFTTTYSSKLIASRKEIKITRPGEDLDAGTIVIIK
jgi:hypothetical protein